MNGFDIVMVITIILFARELELWFIFDRLPPLPRGIRRDMAGESAL
jgi:hypothetical protein